jgi:hypothetical protein
MLSSNVWGIVLFSQREIAFQAMVQVAWFRLLQKNFLVNIHVK